MRTQPAHCRAWVRELQSDLEVGLVHLPFKLRLHRRSCEDEIIEISLHFLQRGSSPQCLIEPLQVLLTDGRSFHDLRHFLLQEADVFDLPEAFGLTLQQCCRIVIRLFAVIGRVPPELRQS